MHGIVKVEVKVVGNGNIVEMRTRNGPGADLCISEGQKLSKYALYWEI